jgi:hypothetical protein
MRISAGVCCAPAMKDLARTRTRGPMALSPQTTTNYFR